MHDEEESANKDKNMRKKRTEIEWERRTRQEVYDIFGGPETNDVVKTIFLKNLLRYLY